MMNLQESKNVVRSGSPVMTAVNRKSTGDESLSSAVSAFESMTSPTSVRENILNRLDGFQKAPEACRRLINACDSSGGNLLHHVASFETDKTAGFVSQLADLGVDINAQDGKGASPLFYAVSQKLSSAVLVSSFLTAGADPNAERMGKSVLVDAIMTRAPVDNLIALLEHSNTAVPETVTLSSGSQMTFEALVARTYKGSDLQRLQACLVQKTA